MSTRPSDATPRSVTDIAASEPLVHPAIASVRLFEYPHAPGPHLKKLYTLFWKGVSEQYTHAPTRITALLPRGSGKSEGAGVVIPTWLTLKYPELRIAVISKTSDLASKRTRKAIEHIEEYAPEFGVELETPVPDTEVRTKANDHTEPTLAAYGLESQLTGDHFDVIIWDDIADWENQRTAVQRRKVRSYFDDYEKNLPDSDSALPNGPVQLMIGTRKHPQDIYATNVLDSPRWHVVKHTQVKESDWKLVENREWSIRGTDGELYDDVGDLPEGVAVAPNGVIPDRDVTVLWPEQQPPEAVLTDLVDGDESLAIWRRENQLDPEALSGAVFKSEWLRFVDDLPHPPTALQWYGWMDIGVIEDLEEAAANDGDFSAVGVMAWHPTNETGFIAGLARKRGLSVKENADWGARAFREIAGAYGGVDYSLIRVETNKAPGVFQRLRDKTDLPVEGHASTGSKESRIHDASASFQDATVKVLGEPDALTSPLADETETWGDFEVDEWLQFPNAGHDDRLDVLAGLIDMGDVGDRGLTRSEHDLSDVF